jgi:hypothetical protein
LFFAYLIIEGSYFGHPKHPSLLSLLLRFFLHFDLLDNFGRESVSCPECDFDGLYVGNGIVELEK